MGDGYEFVSRRWSENAHECLVQDWGSRDHCYGEASRQRNIWVMRFVPVKEGFKGEKLMGGLLKKNGWKLKGRGVFRYFSL
jgi:hypothetical protein